MAYDRELADRLRVLLAGRPDVTEKAMFGGLAFLLNGNLAVSASNTGGLLLRVDPSRTQELVADPAAAHFEMRGRAMHGWLRVDPRGVQTDDDLERWVALGIDYASALPPKA